MDPSKIIIEQILVQKGAKVVALTNLTGATTISELKKKFCEQEGKDKDKEPVFLFGGKQLTDENKNLVHYNIRNNSALTVMFRVVGGAEGVENTNDEGTIDPTDFDDNDGPEVRKLTILMKDWPKEVKPTLKACLYTLGTCEGLERNAQMPCNQNHILSAEGMFQHLKNTIKVNGKCSIRCVDKSCDILWEPSICFWVANLSSDEEKEYSWQLDKNYINSNRDMKECPFCSVCLYKKDLSQNRVRCIICKSKDWCWQCGGSWKNPLDNLKCGNDICIQKAKNLEAALNCEKSTISGIPDVPIVRLCPRCDTLVQWKNKCKHLTCPNKACEHEFCIVCLREWKLVGKNNHIYERTEEKCPLQPIQEYTFDKSSFSK